MESKNIRYINLGIVVLCLIAFSPLFKAEFMGYDDPEYVLNNIYIKSFTFDNITSLFSIGPFDLYIPVTYLSYMIEYSLFGANAKVFHVVNLALHAINVILLFKILLALKIKNNYLVWFILLFFAINPLVTESVCWITERKDVLYCLFGFLSGLQTIVYLENKNLKSLLLAFLFFVLACLSKPMAITFPVLVLIYIVYKEEKFNLKKVSFLLPFFVVSATLALVSMQLIGSKAEFKIPNYTFFEKLCLVFSETGFYFFKPFLPVYQQLIHLLPQKGQVFSNTSVVIFALLGLLIISLVAFVGIKHKNKSAVLLFLAWLVFLAPILQFYPNTHSYVSERYFYVSIVFPVILTFMFLEHIQVKEQNLKVGLMVLCVLFTILTIRRSNLWLNTRALFTQEVKMDKKNHIALNNLGYYYNSIAEFSTAKPLLEDAIALDDNAVYLNNYGWSLSGLFETDNAIAYFEKALKKKENFIPALNNLGICHAQKNNMNLAEYYFNKAYELDHNNNESLYYLGLYYLNSGQAEKGQPLMNRAYALGNPDAEKYVLH